MRAPLGSLLTSLNVDGGEGGKGGGRTGNRRRTTMMSRKWRWIRMRPEKEGKGRGRVKRMKDEFCPSKSQMLQGTLSIPMLNTSML